MSARTGAGIDELRAALDRASAALGSRADAGSSAARLHIDRVFTIRGAGTVVTGTLWSGEIGRGDELEVLPQGRRVRVRGVQVHDQPVDRAPAGQRVAVNLTGAGDRRDRPRRRARRHRLRGPSELPGRRRARVRRRRGARARRARADPPRHARGAGTPGLARGPVLAGPARAADRAGRRRPARGTSDRAAGHARRRRGAGPAAAPPRSEPRRAGQARAVGSRRSAGAVARGAATDRTGDWIPPTHPHRPTDAERGEAWARSKSIPCRAPRSRSSSGSATPAFEPPIDSELDAGDLAALREAGRAVRVTKNLHYHVDALADIRARLIELAKRNGGAVTLAQLRDELCTSRKFAQALLEHFDSEKVTIRRGDEHVLRRSAG